MWHGFPVTGSGKVRHVPADRLCLCKEETDMVSSQGGSMGQQHLTFALLDTTERHAGCFRAVMRPQHEGLALLGSIITLSFV